MWYTISRSNAPEGVVIDVKGDKKSAQLFLINFIKVEKQGTMRKNKMSGFYFVNGIKMTAHIEYRRKAA